MGVVREGFVEKVTFEQKWKEVREQDMELFGKLVLKAEETTGVKALRRREPGVPRGSKETSVGGVEGARSQKGMGALRTVGELWLDSVEVEDLGKVLNRGMTELDLVFKNRMALAAVLRGVSR